MLCQRGGKRALGNEGLQGYLFCRWTWVLCIKARRSTRHARGLHMTCDGPQRSKPLGFCSPVHHN